MILKDKKDWRKRFASLRASLPDDDRAIKDAKIGEFCLTLIRQKKFQAIYFFYPFRGEPNVWNIARSLDSMPMALPVMVEQDMGQMVFVSVTPETPLLANHFGILEPAYTKDLVVQPSPGALVIVPALAVDHGGVRLGYGGGYYDRYFGALSQDKRPFLAAVLYKDFFVPRLPCEAHDLKVDCIVTEEGLFEISSRC